MSSLVSTTMADGPSPSTRLMLDPVISIFSIFCACCANAGVVAATASVAAPAPRARATAMARGSVRTFIVVFLLGFGRETGARGSRELLGQQLGMQDVQGAFGAGDEL